MVGGLAILNAPAPTNLVTIIAGSVEYFNQARVGGNAQRTNLIVRWRCHQD